MAQGQRVAVRETQRAVGGQVPVNPAQAPKITSWKNEPTVQDLQNDLEASRPAHDTHVSNVVRWNDLNKVTGSAKPKKIRGRSNVQPKLIRRQAEWRYSALTEPFNSSDKLFDVTPVEGSDAEAARQNELVLNWQFRTKLNRVKFIDDYVRANVDEGSAIVRLGWHRIEKEVDVEVPVYDIVEPSDEKQIAELEAAVALKQQDPKKYEQIVPEEIRQGVSFFEETGQPGIGIQRGTETKKVKKAIDNRPLLSVMNPQNVYIDPSCGNDLNKAGFVIVSFETSKSEMIKDKRYKNLKYVNWENASAIMEPNHMPNSKDVNFNFQDALRKRVVAYEYWGYWDVEGNDELVPIVATWVGGVLVRMEENPFPDGKPPFVVVNYMPIKRELMGEPDAELLEDNQNIHGAVARGMIDLLGRSANSQQGFAKGMLDTLNRRRFESGQDYEFNPNMPPQQGHVEHKYPEIPQSAMLMLTMQNQEAEALTGVKAFSGGISGEAYGEVAAGIRGVLDAASKREMAILRRLANGLVEIGRKIIAMNAVFLSEEEIIRVTNEEFVTVKREDLHGEFDLKVDISTAEIDNNKASDLGFMLQTLGNNMDFGITKIILMEIARLKRMPELVMSIKNFEPKPDPMAQKIAELQVKELEMKIQKLASEIKLNEAKADKTEVEAEQGALDTIEQETGTKHARDMEKTAGQAGANADLEITKALVKPRKTKDGAEKDPDVEAAAGWNELAKRKRDPRSSNEGPQNSTGNITSIPERQGMVETDPRFNLGSQEFTPEMDPALNPAINL